MTTTTVTPDYFSTIVGNDPIKQSLTRMVERNAVGNSLLFAGPDGIGKSLFATAFAKLLFGLDLNASIEHHPDLHVYHPEGKIGKHSISSMHAFQQEVFMAPYDANRKVFILHDAERMLSYSANALLKTFEEPTLDSVIILLSSSPQMLLPTVASRCRTIRFQAIPDETILQLLQQEKGLSLTDATHYAELAQGSIERAYTLLDEQGDPLREQIVPILAQGHFSDFHALTQTIETLCQVIEQHQKSVEEELRKERDEAEKIDLTAVQKHAIEKEIEGALATRLVEEAAHLFDLILAWYRDLHLLRVNGNRRYLIHKEAQSTLEQAVMRGGLLPIEHVQESVREARLALERSTALRICLETLFLKLQFI